MFYDDSKEMQYDLETNNNLEKDGKKRGFFGYEYRNLQKDTNSEIPNNNLEKKSGANCSPTNK